MREDEDVLGAVAEWGNDQRNDVEPVEEVFAESALLDRVFERSIGCAHDPDIGPAFLRLAEPFVGLVVEESEQPGLSIRGEVADLVEKECPTFGLFHLADSVCHAAGKGALAVTEQGACHQVAGEHRTVNSHERPVRELALGLNPAGQDVLAGAALATKHDDRVGCRGARHRLEQSPEDRAIGLEDGLALGLLDPLLQFSDLPLEFRLGDHAASGVPDLGRREGLRQVVNRQAQLHRLDGRLKRGEGRDDDDPDFGLAAENLGQQRESRLLAQPEVKEDHIEPAPLDGLEAAGRRPHPHRPTAVGLQA